MKIFQKEFYQLGSECFVVLDSSLDTYGNSMVYRNGKRIKNFKGITLHVLCELLKRNNERCTQEYLSKAVWDEDKHPAKENVDSTGRGGAVAVAKEIGKIRDRCLCADERDNILEEGYIIHAKKVPHYFKINESEYADNTLSSKYIERTAELNDLMSTAFRDARTHAIVGERGIGKTVLAQCFAEKTHASGKYEYILFTRYQNSLRDTVSQLPAYVRLSESVDLYEEKIYLLKDLQKLGKALLIIDNYDNTNYRDELSSDNAVYRELLNTGCDILFVSYTNLSECYNGRDDTGLRTTHVAPLPTRKLIEKFREIKGDSADNETDLRHLIEDLLKGNTYLVTMAARLSAKTGVESVINAFDSLSTENTRPINDTKDGRKQKPASIYRHYCVFLQNHPVMEDPDYTKLLVNLSLLPLDGLQYDEFFELAFPPKEQNHNKALLADLVDHFLAFENNDIVYLHPIIREYIVDHLLSEEKLISSYLNCSIKHLVIETYSQDAVYWLWIGQSVENSLKNKEENFCPWGRARLNAYMASSYDVMSIKESAYAFGIRAIEMLNKVDVDNLTDNDKLILADCYNVSGYAVLHRSEKILQDDWASAHGAILKAMEILNGTNRSDYSDSLLTKIHGNIGACYLKIGDYERAKEWHERALAERLEMLARNNSIENKFLIYKAYRCLGADCFYLSRKENGKKAQFLKESYENNEKSLRGYIGIYGPDHLECTIGRNRLIGTGLELISVLQDDALLKEATGKTFDELVDYFYIFIRDSVACLANIEAAINSEIKDCLQKAEKLTELLDSRNRLTEDILDFNIRAAEKLSAVPEISSDVQTMIDAILSKSRKVK